MELSLQQQQTLSQIQLQSIRLLQMSSMELDAYLQEIALENPLIEPLEVPDDIRPDEALLQRLRWLEETDRQNRSYQPDPERDLDPFLQIGNGGGLEETLPHYLEWQLSQMDLPEETAYAVSLLIACLDETGYLRDPLSELSEDLCVPLALLQEANDILRTMEPAGVGAADLADCLLLQLDRRESTGLAAAIVSQCLPLLARSGYRQIAKLLKCSEKEVRSACDLIRQLNPKPGAVFHQPSQTVYVRPDIYVRMNGDIPEVSSAYEERERFRISRYYTGLLKETSDKQAKAYLTEKLQQAQSLQWVIAQRKSTLLRCTQVIAERQKDFFLSGHDRLHPLRMREVAEALNLHNSTVSRAVRAKYLQCSWGLFPLSFFFTQEASNGIGHSTTEAKSLLKKIIEGENAAAPFSDQTIAEKLSQSGCPISRRTVAKYRNELGIPPACKRGGS